MEKALLISHNVLDKRTAMGKTIAAFFEGWEAGKLAQLYFHSEVPTMDMCSRYYRITDTDVLKSVLCKPQNDVGRRFAATQVDTKRTSSRTDAGFKHKIYSFCRRRKSYIYLARNTMWRLSHWYTKDLKNWIKEFSPDVIFFAAGDYAFAYDIAYTIAKDFDIPMVTYICDDYFINYQNPKSLLGKPVHRDLMRSVNSCMEHTANIITICDKLSDAYRGLFDKPIHTIYTGYSKRGEICADGEGIVYLGNLGFTRHKSLVDIGRALKRISERTGRHYHLDVYSAETREEILRELTEENGIVFHGAVGSDEVNRIISRSRLVVHVESFKPENIRKVQYSISTKIADLLASGHCILAYGPGNVASLEYLRDNKAAFVVTDQTQLEAELEDILANRERRLAIIQAAQQLAEKNHNASMVAERVKEIIESSVKD